jgi:HAE1 family hydrophobic/amphiphilic exporter-1
MTMIGIIMLMGLVTKNGFAYRLHHQQRQGHGTEKALLTSGRIRLRPIIMTTTAMIFACCRSRSGSVRARSSAPMARAVIGGLMIFHTPRCSSCPWSTILDDMVHMRIGGLLMRLRRRAGEATAEPEPVAAGGD